MKKLLLVLLALPLIGFGQVPGCTDSLSCNYNALATIDDGSCVYPTTSTTIITICDSSYTWNGTSYDSSGTYSYNGTGFFEQIGLDINGESYNDKSGNSVSVSSDGQTVAIGARENDANTGNAADDIGHVRIYNFDGISWTQIGQDIDGETFYNESGYSVSLSSDGSIVAIGARYNNFQAGHVRVYQNVGGSWSQIGSDIDGEAGGDESGYSVSLSSDGSTVAIGAIGNGGNGGSSGHVRVYQNVGGSWTQIGQDIDGEASLDGSGYSVSLSANGSTLAIGAWRNDGNGLDAGHVRVYQNVAGSWSQIGSDINGEAAGDLCGLSVSLSDDGSTLAIGAVNNAGNGSGSGHVRVYQNVAGSWSQVGQDINGEAAGDKFGWSVSLSSSGETVAIGASQNAGNGNNSGHVRVYQNVAGSWYQQGQDINGEAAQDWSGYSVSLSDDGSKVAIGAIGNGGNGGSSGHVRVYQLSNLISANGCDSTAILNLTINNSLSTSNTQSICSGQSITVGSNIYNTTGNYTDTLVSSNSCDSIVYTNLNIEQNTSSYDTLVSAISINWNSIILNSSGDYSVTLTNSVGCDSIANLNLTVTTTGISDIVNNKSKLIKITDMLGQETPYRRNTTLFYIYNDGTVEKKVVIE